MELVAYLLDLSVELHMRNVAILRILHSHTLVHLDISSGSASTYLEKELEWG